jgi:hypothetical protein
VEIDRVVRPSGTMEAWDNQLWLGSGVVITF